MLQRLLVATCLCSVPGCAPVSNEQPAQAASAEVQPEAEPLVLSTTEAPPPDEALSLVGEAFGDFDAMVERRVVRALVTFSLTNYFLDGPTQRGITYEALKAFEKEINDELGTGHLKVHVVIFPVARDQLIPLLREGKGDIAAANLTITPERGELVDFSTPAYSGVNELVVTGPASPEIATLDDLSGKEVHVRVSSSYYETLVEFNGRLREMKREEIQIVPADEHFEDEDLLQMVDAGLLPAIVVDSHKARFWEQIFENVEVRSDLAVRTGGEIARAFRKNSPELAKVVNAFIAKNRKGTLLGNILLKRYLQNTKWVEKALSGEGIEKFSATIDFFKTYGKQYDFDWLMLAALGYQESGLDQSVRSGAGAVGIMQVLPSTARDPNVGIPNIEEIEANIHAGTKYLRFLLDRYFGDAPMSDTEKVLFTFASYNAGPARVRGLRRKAEAAGLDPNLWFDNVEVIAAREIGRETVQYVSNIYKYYIAYKLIAAQKGQRPRV